jgi:hypothetical protein
MPQSRKTAPVSVPPIPSPRAQKSAPIPAPEIESDMSADSDFVAATQNATSYRDVASELFPEYIKPADLHAFGAFYIERATRRYSVRFRKDECVYAVRLADTGASGILTLTSNEVRDRMVAQVEKHGMIGPLKLVQGEAKSDDQSGAWMFADANADDSQEDLPF